MEKDNDYKDFKETNVRIRVNDRWTNLGSEINSEVNTDSEINKNIK